MNKLEACLNKIYKPKPKPWKRKVLFFLSSFIVCAVTIGGYNQYVYGYTDNGIWWFYGFFGVLGMGGLYTSIFGKEFWVALFLGGL